jgi:hypothetical protein
MRARKKTSSRDMTSFVYPKVLAEQMFENLFNTLFFPLSFKKNEKGKEIQGLKPTLSRRY